MEQPLISRWIEDRLASLRPLYFQLYQRDCMLSEDEPFSQEFSDLDDEVRHLVKLLEGLKVSQ